MMFDVMRLRIKRSSTNSTVLKPLQNRKRSLHGNFPRMRDSLFYNSFFLYKVSQVKSHYVGHEFSRAMILSCLTLKSGCILLYLHGDLVPYEILNFVIPKAKY